METVRRLLSTSLNQTGMILPLILVFLALGLLLITPALGHGYSALAGTTVVENKAEQLHAADSGIEEGLYWLIKGRPNNEYWTWDGDLDPPGTRAQYELNDVTVTVTIRQHSSDYYLIRSEAEGPDGSTTVLAQVWAVPGYVELDDLGDGHDGNVYIDGNAKLEGDGQINGNVIVIGNVKLEDNSTVDGSVSVTGNYKQEDNTTVTGNVCVGGNIALENNAHIEGDIYLVLKPGAVVTIRLENSGSSAGDLFVATESGTATLTIRMEGDFAIGNIWVTPSVSFTLRREGAATHGSVNTNWDRIDPPPPDCPHFSGSGSGIASYEIT